MYRNSEVIWKPILGQHGLLLGVALNTDFAQECINFKLTAAEQAAVHDRLWEITKPQDWHDRYVPSDIFHWYEDSLLPQAIYSRHAGSGKWLDTETFRLNRLDNEIALTYSYHHSRWDDVSRNFWLQYAFDWWSKLARIKLEKRAESEGL